MARGRDPICSGASKNLACCSLRKPTLPNGGCAPNSELYVFSFHINPSMAKSPHDLLTATCPRTVLCNNFPSDPCCDQVHSELPQDPLGQTIASSGGGDPGVIPVDDWVGNNSPDVVAYASLPIQPVQPVGSCPSWKRALMFC